jgi:hypothetical protein
VRCDLEEARRPEVRDLQHVVLGHQDVGRSQVAMNDALRVRVIDGVADLAGEIERPTQINRATSSNDVLERLSLDVLHHDEEDVFLLLGGRDRDDIWMADAGQESRLAQ